jgi:hypothetical protein
MKTSHHRAVYCVPMSHPMSHPRRHTPPSSGSPHRFARRPGTVFIAAMSQNSSGSGFCLARSLKIMTWRKPPTVKTSPVDGEISSICRTGRWTASQQCLYLRFCSFLGHHFGSPVPQLQALEVQTDSLHCTTYIKSFTTRMDTSGSY